MALYTKYRPDDFGTMIGNGPVVAAVQKILSKKDIPHAWMFTGHSGIGKTTIARIIAKKLGATGSGIFETNAADVRGIDGIREIIEKVQYRSPGSPVSVFILDECHQLTKDAQNALLKALEDAPAHAYFILCTTDPQKVIDTIRTRCQEFKFAPLGVDDLVEIVMTVSEAEKIDLDATIITEIAKNAGGSPRLALTMLERCQAVASPEEAIKLISGMGLNLQTEGEFAVSGKIVDVLLSRKPARQAWPMVARILDADLFAAHADVNELKKGITSRLGRMLLKTYNPGIAEAILVLENNKDYYSNASFAGIMHKVTTLVCSAAQGENNVGEGPL